MANITTDFSAGRKPMPYPNDQGVVPLMFDYALPSGQAYALNDTIELGILPSNTIPVDCFIAYEAMAATGAVSLGVLNTGKTDLDTSASSGGAAWIGATTVSSAGLTRATTPACMKTTSSTGNRSLALKVTTALGTPVAGARIIVVVLVRSAP